MKRALLILLAAVLPSFATAAVTITFDAQKVHISGVSPRGDVALVAMLVSREGDYVSRVSRVEQILPDAVGAGSVDFDLGRAIPPLSIWTAVDMSTGEYSVKAPQGFEATPMQLSFDLVKNSTVADLDEIGVDMPLVRVLWVRPDAKHGEAWFGIVGDGSKVDDDHSVNGHIHFRSDSFKPIGASGKPPAKFKTGDVVVLIDHYSLQYYATTVVKR